MPRAEVFIRVGAELAEGPVWLADRSQLAWVDILRGHVVQADAQGELVSVATLDEPVGAVAQTDRGGLVAATSSGLRSLDHGGRLVAALPRRRPDLRMNDGKADPVGRFVGGTMTLGTPVPGAGSLWSFDGGTTKELITGVTISNGLCWSADGGTLFYIDTPTHHVDAFDYDVTSGALGVRRTVVSIDPADGDPDGMTIDSEGALWVALWGGGEVRRYVDGRLDEVIDVPTPYVTSVAFAGADLSSLVITTATLPFGSEPPAGAGDIFITHPGAAGLPSSVYRLPDIPTGHP